VKLPLVSIVMPTFNSERFVAEAIYSLIGQTYPRFEVIVVDGGSTDKTVEIVESYIGGDEDNLRVIKLSREEGSMPKSLNRGLKEAEGDFIARMDADDVAMPTLDVPMPEQSRVEPQSSPFVQREEILLWNRWALFAIVGLLSLEWFIRKFNSLS